MARQWQTCRAGHPVAGPYAAHELRQQVATGQLLPTDLVWTLGMPRWILARQLRGLFADQPAAPPKPPPIAPLSAPRESRPADGLPQGAQEADWRAAAPPPPPPSSAAPSDDAPDLRVFDFEEPATYNYAQNVSYSEPEPWYYGFVATYVRVMMWVGTAGLIIGFLAFAWSIVSAARINGPTPLTFLSMIVGLVATGFAILGILVTSAMYLIVVDAARNLRSIERKTGP